MSDKLAGKIALVTGGSRGIGASIAKRLAADADSTRAAVAKTVKSFGGLDILVNNGGVAAVAPIEQFSIEDFERIIAINIRGMLVATQEAVRHMRDGGRVIHIGSCNSSRVAFQGGSVYALSKAAVVGFTKGLARDLGPRGITGEQRPARTDRHRHESRQSGVGEGDG